MTRKNSLLLYHAFDAYAGSQRVAAALVKVLRQRGHDVEVRLGFGRIGFISAVSGVSRFLAIEDIAWRKRLYPAWLMVANLGAIALLFSRRIVWANSIHALPAVLPMLLAPRRLVIHIHEIDFPAIFLRLLRFAVARGALLVVVSQTQGDMLGLPCRVLPNAVGDVPPPPPAERRRLIFVGNSHRKGFDLFTAIVQQLDAMPLEAVAYIADMPTIDNRTPLALARRAGITVITGETDPRAMFADAWMLMQLTDPALWTETFSLVAAEAVWNLVPVGAAGAAVIDEVAAGAIAFNEASRDPAVIAASIRALWDDPAAYAVLVAGCAVRREDYRADRFADGAEAILAGAARA